MTKGVLENKYKTTTEISFDGCRRERPLKPTKKHFSCSSSSSRSQNTENYYFFIEFSSFFRFSHRLRCCQRLANRLLSLLFMKLYFFIDFLLFTPLPVPSSFRFRLFSLSLLFGVVRIKVITLDASLSNFLGQEEQNNKLEIGPDRV